MKRFIALNRANPASIFNDIDFVIKSGMEGRNIELAYFDYELKKKNRLTEGKIAHKNKCFNIKFYRMFDDLKFVEIFLLFFIGLTKTVQLLISVLFKIRNHRVTFLGEELTEPIVSRINRDGSRPYRNIKRCYSIVLKSLLVTYFFKNCMPQRVNQSCEILYKILKKRSKK